MPYGERDAAGGRLDKMPKCEVATDCTQADITWADFGYHAAYRDSCERVAELQAEGVALGGLRLQAQYPTPLTCLTYFIADHDRAGVESYTAGLLADADQLLEALPHEAIAFQWDVAMEFVCFAARSISNASVPSMSSSSGS